MSTTYIGPASHERLHYSAYWGTWSRLLGIIDGNFIEVNLTPIPNCYDDSWDKVGKVWIRRHGTARDAKDIETRDCPFPIHDRMVQQLGDVKTNFLLFANILPMIDWEKFGAANNGGCALIACRKE